MRLQQVKGKEERYPLEWAALSREEKKRQFRDLMATPRWQHFPPEFHDHVFGLYPELRHNFRPATDGN